MRIKLTRRWHWLAAIGGTLVVVCLGLGLADWLSWRLRPKVGDLMDWKAAYIAGVRGVNCGRVKVRNDATSATQCALKAEAEGRPFRVTYEILGYDAIVAGGIVRTPDGRIFALTYDSCPRGCGYDLFAQSVQVTPCPQPYHLYVNPKSRINCFQAELSQPRDIMSPNIEPY
jgi:hypothetical protein